MENEVTMIKVKIKTKNRLKKLKIIPRESLNDVISRIVDSINILYKDKDKIIFEIGDIIHIRKTITGRMLTPKEILNSVEYQKEFKPKYPELSKFVEKTE